MLPGTDVHSVHKYPSIVCQINYLDFIYCQPRCEGVWGSLDHINVLYPPSISFTSGYPEAHCTRSSSWYLGAFTGVEMADFLIDLDAQNVAVRAYHYSARFPSFCINGVFGMFYRTGIKGYFIKMSVSSSKSLCAFEISLIVNLGSNYYSSTPRNEI